MKPSTPAPGQHSGWGHKWSPQQRAIIEVIPWQLGHVITEIFAGMLQQLWLSRGHLSSIVGWTGTAAWICWRMHAHSPDEIFIMECEVWRASSVASTWPMVIWKTCCSSSFFFLFFFFFGGGGALYNNLWWWLWMRKTNSHRSGENQTHNRTDVSNGIVLMASCMDDGGLMDVRYCTCMQCVGKSFPW